NVEMVVILDAILDDFFQCLLDHATQRSFDHFVVSECFFFIAAHLLSGSISSAQCSQTSAVCHLNLSETYLDYGEEMGAVLLLGLPPRPTLSITRQGIEMLPGQAAVKQREPVSVALLQPHCR